MNKQQQIEEIAMDIRDALEYETYENYVTRRKDLILTGCRFYDIAEIFYEQGHRKLPKDSVVLSKEEYDNLKLQIQKAHNKGVQAGFDMTKFKEQSIRKQAVKEFAEKLKKKVHNYYPSIDSYCTSRHVILVKDIDELLKEYEK